MFRCWDFDFYPRVPCKPLRLNSTLEAPVRLAKSRMSCLVSDMGHGSPSGGWKPAIPCNQVVNTEPEASLCSLMWRPKRPLKGPWQLLRSNFCQVEYIHVYPWVVPPKIWLPEILSVVQLSQADRSVSIHHFIWWFLVSWAAHRRWRLTRRVDSKVQVAR